MALLTCRDVSLGYEGKAVVTGLNFTVNTGNYLCVVGENGSGKTTLMKTILRLNSPLSGEISTGEGLKRNEIGYLPQQTLVQRDFPASVREIVMSGCLNRCGMRPFFTKAEKQLSEQNMEILGVSQLANRCYRELSGGQQQRVLLARALCATRRLLLLDEPVAALDPQATEEMYNLIETLHQSGTTIIMISHDIGGALKYADCVLHIGCKPEYFSTRQQYLDSEYGKQYPSENGGGCNV